MDHFPVMKLVLGDHMHVHMHTHMHARTHIHRVNIAARRDMLLLVYGWVDELFSAGH